MGNKLGRRRQVVDEKYTKPQGLYQHKDVDIKKLRKLILESKLAPCYPGDDECTYCDLEECPICFLYYPSLNRSRCCLKGICTECFLQMKTPNSTRPTQCPFCKTSNYAVEYRGVKTKEEKSLEQIEEQRVIEAKIRIHQQEIHDEEERMQKREGISSSATELEYSSAPVPSPRYHVEGDEIVSSQDSCAAPVTRRPQHLRPNSNRDDEFDLDLEDIMVMEAIWLSIQENGRHRNTAYGCLPPPPPPPGLYVTEDRYVSQAMVPLAGSSSSPSGGLACAIAALAERQQIGGDSSTNHNGNTSASTTHPGLSRFYNRADPDPDCYPITRNSIELLPDCRTTVTRDDEEWNVDRGSAGAEAGTSYASSDVAEDTGGISPLPQPDQLEGSFQNVTRILPESFEEQMMLAMAVSLAEDRAMTTGPGVSWQ